MLNTALVFTFKTLKWNKSILKLKILYTGKYLPLLCFLTLSPSCEWANLRVSKFQGLKLSPLEHNCVWAIPTWVETICKCWRAKITWGKNNPAYSYEYLQYNKEYWFCLFASCQKELVACLPWYIFKFF